jgi:hypothetical protein
MSASSAGGSCLDWERCCGTLLRLALVFYIPLSQSFNILLVLMFQGAMPSLFLIISL